MNEVIGQVIDIIQRSQKILVVPSCPPDGDSIGSALALYESLQKLGKKVTVVCADPVPTPLQFLPNSKFIEDAIKDNKDFIVTLDCNEAQVDKLKYEIVDNKVNIIITPKNGAFSEKHVSFKQSGPDFDLVIAVDTADIKQLGSIYENNTNFFYNVTVVNIDHHISNSNFGKINYVDSAASSTTEILTEILKELEKREGRKIIDERVATYLLTGILTDTGSFQNPNTTPKSLEISAELVERGASQQEIVKHVFRTKNLSTLKLWGEVLSKIETDEKHRLVWSTMTRADLLKTNANIEEISGLIDEMLVNAPGAEIVFIIKEDEDKISCSMRSTTSAANVAEIAEHFGGGGHIQASGFRIPGTSLKEAEQEIIPYIRQYQAKRLHFDTGHETKQIFKPVTEQESKQVEMRKAPTENYISKLNEHFLDGEPAKEPSPEIFRNPAQDEVRESSIPQSSVRHEAETRKNNIPQMYAQSGPVGGMIPPVPHKKKRRRKKRHPSTGQPMPSWTQAPQPHAQTETGGSNVPQVPMRNEMRREVPQAPPTPQKTAPPMPPGPQEKPQAIMREIASAPIPPVQPMPPAPPTPPVPQVPPAPQKPAEQPVSWPPAPQAQNEIKKQEPQPRRETPRSTPSFNPFSPPNPDESDILAALSKL